MAIKFVRGHEGNPDYAYLDMATRIDHSTDPDFEDSFDDDYVTASLGGQDEDAGSDR